MREGLSLISNFIYDVLTYLRLEGDNNLFDIKMD